MWVYEKKVLYTSSTYRKNGDMKEKHIDFEGRTLYNEIVFKN